LSHGLINWTNYIIWGLNFDQEDWFLESWLTGELTSVENSSCGWNNLTTSSVDSISMKIDIMDIESTSSHVFVTQGTFFGGPLESSLN
jgi:hypothetical protein